MSKPWLTYLLLCADGTLYCGVTNDMEKRLSAHNRGQGSRFTRTRLPVTLLATSRPMGKAEACRLEYRIKRLPREKKRAMLKAEGPGSIKSTQHSLDKGMNLCPLPGDISIGR